MFKTLIIGLWCFFLPCLAMTQETSFPIGEAPDGTVRADLKALDKEIMVGKPFRAQLEVTHPADMVVIFPDTNGGFAPFEMKSKSPKPTRTKGDISVDFVLYDLWSWEVDSLQYLQLPVSYIKGDDTLTLLSNAEELAFISILPEDNDSLAFKRIENIAQVSEPVNLVMWGFSILLLVALLSILLGMLYKPVRKWLRRKKIDREWKRYYGRLQKVPGYLPNQGTFLLELAKVWKAYFDREWKYGLGSLSTKELAKELDEMEQVAMEDRSILFQLNHSADNVTYGGIQLQGSELDGYFTKVGRIMEQEYLRRKTEAEL